MPQDDTVNSLINQLKDASALSSNVSSANLDDLNIPKEELEQFVINNAGKLILDCLETIQNYKDMIITAPNPDDVRSYADLISASTKALESLNKIIVQDKRSKTTMDVKKIELEQKKELIEHKAVTEAYVSTREELFKKLMDESDEKVAVVDVDEAGTDNTLLTSVSDT